MSSQASKILQKMRSSAAGWRPRDIETVLTGFGFGFREGSNHRIYEHPDHDDLMVTVPRHGELARFIVFQVVETVEKAIGRQRSVGCDGESGGGEPLTPRESGGA
jgi:predicted RNA binding protein YcfA (HicA-like mRNA interferase family)